jgi:5-methylcytosine-specific restriction endonuclease McrA
MTQGQSQGRYKSRGLVQIIRRPRFVKLPLLNTQEEIERRERAMAEIRLVKKIASIRRGARKRQERLSNTPYDQRITTDEWRYILERYNYTCAYCGEAKKLGKDHVVPLSRGGTHTKNNIIPACKPCNVKKGDGDPRYYKPLIFPDLTTSLIGLPPFPLTLRT